MKLRVARDVLAEAVAWTARSVPPNPPVPVLAGVRMEAKGDVVILSSFDYEVSGRCEIPASVEVEGEVLIPGRALTKFAKGFPSKPVDIELVGTRVRFTCGSAHSELPAMQVDDYPALPSMPAQVGTIDSDVLSKAVAQVSIAAARDDTLPLLTNVCMEFSGNKLTMLATDRYRLAMREVEWNPAKPLDAVVLLKARTLADVAKSLVSGAPIEIALNDDAAVASRLIGFESGERRTTSVLSDGEYPQVRRLFPEQVNTYATVGRKELLDAVKFVSLVAERNTALRLTFTEGNLHLEAGQGEDAQASEELVAHLDGNEISAAFNPLFLQEGLNALASNYVRFDFTHPNKPAVLVGVDEPGAEPDPSFRYLLMPIRFGV